MAIRRILLLVLLIINSYSFIEDDTFLKDFITCGLGGSEDSATIEECLALNSNLNGTGDSESQCCRITAIDDPFRNMKQINKGLWKEKYMEILKINEAQLEEEIKKRYDSVSTMNACSALIKKNRKAELYGLSLMVNGNKITSNCGDTEETFDPKDFYPLTEKEKFYKDILDCRVQYGEKECIDKSYKLLSSNTQACWCEETFVFVSSSSIGKGCYGYSIDNFKNELKKYMDDNSGSNGSLTMKCSCLNREGKHVNAFLNSGEITIE